MIQSTTKNKSDRESPQRLKGNILIKNIILPLFLTLTLFSLSEKSAYAQQYRGCYKSSLERDRRLQQMATPQPSYDIDDLQKRLNIYALPKSTISQLLPIESDTIIKFLIENNKNLVPGSEFSFLRDNIIFLITMLRAEEELKKWQDTTNLIIKETMTINDNNNYLLHTWEEQFNFITESIKNTKDSTQLTVLYNKKKELEIEGENIIHKKNTNISLLAKRMEIACKGARELLIIIINLQERLNNPIYLNQLSLQEKDLVTSDYKITKDIYERTNLLFKETFRRELIILEL